MKKGIGKQVDILKVSPPPTNPQPKPVLLLIFSYLQWKMQIWSIPRDDLKRWKGCSRGCRPDPDSYISQKDRSDSSIYNKSRKQSSR